MSFHNPYNFVRTPARDRKILDSGFAGDYDPSKPEREENFSRYWPERYTGEIPVRLRTVTPLFITDPKSKKPGPVEGHCVYDCLKEIPATSLKGTLSSAYEIITNSRYRVFSKKQHEKRLGFRTQANERAASLVPGRISCENGYFSVTLFTGTSNIGKNGPDGPLYAAWLPAYKGRCVLIPDDVQNGEYYQNVELELYTHGGFRLWSVKRIGNRQFQPISSKLTPTGKTMRVDGYVVISGKTINRKHDERFFFNDKTPIQLSIDDKVKKRYEYLIADYQRNHVEVNGRVSNPPNDPKKEGIVFGRHIDDPAMLELKEGDFVYVKTSGASVEALYPVQISRDLNEFSVWDCLDKSLRPASLKTTDDTSKQSPAERYEMSKLSPADRLFGWVNQKGPGSWKGKIQISAGKCKDDDPVKHFETPLTLEILGEPKPSQARFYLGNRDGSPQKNGIPKEETLYKEGKHIRGRKVYLHHKNYTLHYLKKEKVAASNQNRSISSWIPEKKDFYFTIRVENLTSEELGGLLTLLSIDNECCFRLGYGKPLGLGSVRLSIVGDIAVATGRELAERYKNLLSKRKYKLSDSERLKCIKAYQKSMVSAYGNGGFEEVKAPDVLRFEELHNDLNNEQEEKLRNVWQSALENENETMPADEIPESEREILLGLYSEYLEKKYKEDLKSWREYKKQDKKNDFGWGKLDFIESFFASMKGFKEPVRYPFIVKKGSHQAQKGFEWFVQNEKVANRYSLPVIGETLEEINVSDKP